MKTTKGRHEQLTEIMQNIDDLAQEIANIGEGRFGLNAECRAKIRANARAILDQVDRHEALDRFI